jgi:hypothetical protein
MILFNIIINEFGIFIPVLLECKVRFAWDFDLPVLVKSSTYRADTLQELSRIKTLQENV